MLNIYSNRTKYSVLGLFFLIFLLEIFLGGSGRFIQIGPLTLRKINFILGLCITVFLWIYFNKIERYAIVIFCLHTVLISFASFNGIINYGNDERISENFLMQSFLLLMPFYAYFIKTEQNINLVTSVLKFCSIVMAVLYLLVIILMALNVLDFLTVYNFLTTSDEFKGRGENAFFFKGFIYLVIGLFFIENEKKIIPKRLKQVIILAAIYFTFVRGFILALFLSIFIYQLFFKNVWRGILIGVISVFAMLFLSEFYLSQSFSRGQSDNIRKVQLQQVINRVTPISVFIGHGFGEGVPIRKNHLEITYLEIIHKQGLIGLAFWIGILIYVLTLYAKCRANGYEKQAQPFLLSTFFLYIQSATNPFLTNSIGLNILMIAIAALYFYSVQYQKSNYSIN